MDSYQIPCQVIGGEVAAAAGMEGNDWRIHLPADSRQRIVSKMTETLKKHLPFSGQEEIQKIAVRFEERIYTVATSQSDYLRKISLKMLIVETKSQNRMANSLRSSAASNSENPQNPASQSMQTQMQNQLQQLPIPMVSDQSQMHNYGFGRESPDVIIAQLRQELTLKNSEIEELKSKNASLENLVSHLQARVQQDEQKFHDLTSMMSQLNMLG